MVWPLGLKKPGLTDQGVATGVTKFRMASDGLKSSKKVPLSFIVFKILVARSIEGYFRLNMLTNKFGTLLLFLYRT